MIVTNTGVVDPAAGGATGVVVGGGTYYVSGSIGGAGGGSTPTFNAITLLNLGTVDGGTGAFGGGTGGIGVSLSHGTLDIVTSTPFGTFVVADPLPAYGTLSNGGTIAGGAGGNYANPFVPQPGGTGGVGLYLDGGTATNGGAIIGGNGGYSLLGQQGLGGAGVQLQSGTLTNAGTIIGGSGFGAGAAGVLLNGGTLIDSGLISGSLFAVQFGNSAAATLALENGASLTGLVAASTAQNDVLQLTGTQAATLAGFGSQLTGFSTLDFTPGNSWTVHATLAALDAGQTITGFGTADTLILDGFTATTQTYVPGVGIELGTGSSTATLAFTGHYGNGFGVTSNGGNTTITVNAIGTISTAVTQAVVLGTGSYPTTLTVGGTGSVIPSAHYATGITNRLAGASLRNEGTIAGGYGGGIGVDFSAGQLTNDGTIGSLFGGGGLLLTGGSAINNGTIEGPSAVYLSGATLTNAGTIGAPSNAVQFGSQAATLKIDPGAVFVGHVAANSAVDDAMVLAAGTVAGTLTGLGTQFTGFTSVGFAAGAAWTIEIAAGTGPLPRISAQYGAPEMLLVEPGQGTLSGLGTTITGFSTIDFAPGAATLEGNAAALAQGEIIAGVQGGDSLVVDGFVATSVSYVAGSGVELTDGSTTLTLDLAGNLANDVFGLQTGNGNTTLTVQTGTISTLVTQTVMPGNSVYAPALTITNTGSLIPSTSGAVALAVRASGDNVRNQGIITGGDGVSGLGGIGAGVIAGTLTNAGSIAGGVGGQDGFAGSPGGTGLLLRGGTVTNAGTILGGAGASNFFDNGGGGTGVLLIGGTLSNTGTILGGKGGSTFLNSGYPGIGVFLSGGTLTSAGTVAGGDGGLGDAVQFGGTAATLALDPGAVFVGDVVANSSADDVLELGGTMAASLAGIGTSFENFSELSFASGADWTVEGTADGFSNLGTIAGFDSADTIQIDNFAETGFSFDNGDLVLTGTAAPLTLHFAGAHTQQDFLVASQNGQTTIELCYLRGTRILTPTGEIPVEALRIGDRLVTRFGGIRTVKWIGRQSYDWRFVARNPDRRPVRIRAGALGDGMPARDLLMSGGHSVLLGDTLVLARALVNGVSIVYEPVPEDAACARPIDYFQIDFFAHDCVIAEGIFAESFADGPGLRAQFHNEAEFYASYPDHPAPEELLLCARRPLRGAALAAALDSVVARAGAGLCPGPLEGFVDVVRGGLIEGWALDKAYPHLPVMLEIVADGQILGTVLACDERDDLRVAGKGAGRCAFSFTPPAVLAANAPVQVRRAADGAMLGFSTAALSNAA